MSRITLALSAAIFLGCAAFPIAARAQSCNPPPVPTAPGAPGTPTAIAGNAQATVNWPAATGGSEVVQGYTVVASPGPAQATVTGTSATLTGLTNGTSYTFTVSANTVDCASASSVASNSVTPSAPVGQVPGTWANVTPTGFLKSGAYGAQDVVVNPLAPNVLYTTSDSNGFWRSVDYGQSWTKVTNTSYSGDATFNGASTFENQTAYCLEIAPDGSYLIAALAVNSAALISTSKDANGILDGTVWHRYTTQTTNSADVNSNYPLAAYTFDISAANPLHVIATPHNGNWLKQSSDGGHTWTMMSTASWTNTAYAFFITDSIWLGISDGGTFRSTDSGATWAQVGTMTHIHGEDSMLNLGSGSLLLAAMAGVYKSTDFGATWTLDLSVYPWNGESTLVKTASTIYTSAGSPNGGSYGPFLYHEAIGGSWISDANPSGIGMVQGGKKAAVVFDGSRWYVVSGNWTAGVFRYSE